MIKTEEKTYYGQVFRHTYSDVGFKIRKIGTQEVYDDALDLWDSSAQYEETEEKIEVQEEQV